MFSPIRNPEEKCKCEYLMILYNTLILKRTLWFFYS